MRRVPWTRQPPYPVGIDWSNPITRNLVFAFEGANGQRCPISRLSAPLSSGNTRDIGRYGIQQKFSGSQAGGSNNFGALKAISGATQATWDVLFYLDNVSQSAKVFQQWNNNNQNWLIDTSGTGLLWVALDDDSGQRRRWDATNTFPTAGWYRLILVWAGGSSKRARINKVDITASLTEVNNTGTVHGNNLDPLSIGVASDSPLAGKVVFARMWTRALSVAEVVSLEDLPWQIFEPYTVFDNIPLSGPTSYTLIASGGSYTATGSTAILNRNRKLTANGASYTVTGGTAALLRSKRLTLQGGSYNLTGASATLLRSKRITAQGGSYTLLGSSASIFKSRVLLASGGSYVLNGQQITITYTPTAGAYTLTALGGSYTITGSSAVLKRNRSLTAQGGSYALSGASSIIYRSRNLIAQGGSYTTTGSVATLHHNKLLIASGGVYSVAGSQASLLRSKLLTAQGGSYTVTGQQANLSRNRILQALGGAYLISGGSVVIQRSGMVWPSPDQVLLGVQYGPTGADYVGTMDVFGIKYDIVTGNLIKPISDKVVMTL